MKNRRLIVFSAPSGAGKTTIVNYLLSQDLDLSFSVSACSRAKRKGEVEGKHYYFLSLEEFKNKVKQNDFLEWEEVYEGNCYGTLKSEVQRIWSQGKHVIFDVDVIGGLSLKRKFSDICTTVYIKPPSIEILKERLQDRSTETEEKIQMRLRKAEEELTYVDKFDYVIINDDLEKAKQEAMQITRNQLDCINEN